MVQTFHMKAPGQQLELTREELRSLGEMKEKCAPLYSSIVKIVATTSLAIQKAVDTTDVLWAVNKMLNAAEASYDRFAIEHLASEIAINEARVFICCLATKLLSLALNFPAGSAKKAAA